jgi:hypothetical protein
MNEGNLLCKELDHPLASQTLILFSWFEPNLCFAFVPIPFNID